MTTIIGIASSLRVGSFNAALLRAVAALMLDIVGVQRTPFEAK